MIEAILIFTTLLMPLTGGLVSLTASNRATLRIAFVFLLLSFIAAVGLLIYLTDPITYQTEWLPGVVIGLNIDRLSAVLLVLVTFISSLVHLFSGSYMEKDPHKNRYFAKLGLFTFSMLGLLIADDLFSLFIFWELVGVASYLLIGFWFKKEGIPTAARLTFMTNRLADVALLIGILWVHATNDTVLLSELNGKWLLAPSVLIAIGAFGKSAQLPFSGWLIKAMVGPTPVSALIHAATMVAAGVYLLIRVAPFLPLEAEWMIAITGSVTALYGALSAITQNDIKKVLAYSTISQLGFMMAGIGVGAAGASFFHLWTHAFFKAGLFLGAGSIIHYLHLAANEVDAQDMRVMGGLKQKLPWTFRSFLICSVALAGLPLFSGFLSKEAIIVSSMIWADEWGSTAYLIPDLLFFTSLLTAFYVTRMVLLVFFGQSRLVGILDHFSYRESPRFIIPLLILAIGSLWFFHQLHPIGHHPYLMDFLGIKIADGSSFTKFLTLVLSIVLAIGGVSLAYFLFKPGTVFSNVYRHSVIPKHPLTHLSSNGFFLVQAYEAIGKGFFYLSKQVTRIDLLAIDGTINTLATTVILGAKKIADIDLKLIDRILHSIGVGTVILAKVVAILDRLVVDGLVNLSGWLSRSAGTLFSNPHARGMHVQLLWLMSLIILILLIILFF
ncbi:MAG: NADH-quinone oxidoreductase subunit L [Bacteroidota bacterium]